MKIRSSMVRIHPNNRPDINISIALMILIFLGAVILG